MKGPEAKLWQRLHLKLYDVFWTRIENSVSTGIPDLYGACEKSSFFLELKCTKSNSLRISPTQVSWNYSNVSNGGRSFFLAETLFDGTLYLYGGKSGKDLVKHGLKAAPLAVFPAPWDTQKLLHHLKFHKF